MPADKSQTEQLATRRARSHPRRRPLAAGRTALVGANYLHAATGRAVVVVDHEHRRPRTDGVRSRTGRLVVRFADTRLEILFVADPAELLEQLALPCITAPFHPAEQGHNP